MGRFETENQQQQQQQAPTTNFLPKPNPTATTGAPAWEEKPAVPTGQPQLSEYPGAAGLQQQQQQQGGLAAKPLSLTPTDKTAAWEEVPAKPSGKPQMSEFPANDVGFRQTERVHHMDFLKRNSGFQQLQLRRAQQRKQRELENFDLLEQQRQSQRGQQLNQQQFGTLPSKDLLSNQQQMLQQQGIGGGQQHYNQQQRPNTLEDRLLSKPPIRHWANASAIVYQPDIDQAPKFKRHQRVVRQTRGLAARRLRIHRLRHGVAWSIPVYNLERRERGGLSWTIALDADCYANVKSTKKSKGFISKSKKLLNRFSQKIKGVFSSARGGRSSRWIEPAAPPATQHDAVLQQRNAQLAGALPVGIQAQHWVAPQPQFAVRDRRPILAQQRRAIPATNPNAETLVARPFRVREKFRVQRFDAKAIASVGPIDRMHRDGHAMHVCDVPLIRQAEAAELTGVKG